MNEPTGLIYALSDPRTGEVRYIGATSRSLEVRLAEHLQNRRSSAYRVRWINSLLNEGVRPEIAAIAVVPLAELSDAECRWIATYRAAGARLTNTTDGGLMNGVPGIPPEVREKMRQAAIRRMEDPEERAAVSRVHKGKTIPPHVKEAVSLAATKRWADWREAGGVTPPETRARLSQAAKARKPRRQSPETCAKVAELKRQWWAKRREEGLRLKTHCPQGHPYDETNTRVERDGSRKCRTCGRKRAQERRRAKAEARGMEAQ